MKILSTEKDIEPFAQDICRLVDEFIQENSFFREYKMLQWRKSDLYWKGIQYLVDTGDTVGLKSMFDQQDDDEIVPRVINIYKAHGESIIAALGASIPSVKFFPNDAELSEDVDTAKGWSKSWDIIRKRNKLNLLMVKMLYILYQQDFVACYNENTSTKKYGTIKKDIIKDTEVEIPNYYCPECESPMEEDQSMCDSCGQTVIPAMRMEKKIVSRYEGSEEIPKTSEFLRVYGPMNVNIPFWASDPEDLNHLILEEELHLSRARSLYPNFRGQIAHGKGTSADERWMRSAYGAQLLADKMLTCRKVWILPESYELLPDDSRKIFEKKFPAGLKAVILGDDLVVSICEESLHDRWTITRSPFSRHLHADSLGNSLLDIQDVTNDTVNLELQTIEHGIIETFADPEVLDFEAYQDKPAKPGQVTPIKIPPGVTASQFFHSTKPASLSKEVSDFETGLMNYGQFASGAFPSIYGGTVKGSRTVGEYERSRASALQRLSVHYTMLKEFIIEIAEKSVKSFVTNLKDKEIDVEEQEGVFSNNFIIKTDMLGKVGRVEGEASETFPVSWQEKTNRIMELFQLGNPEINASILTPQNTMMLKQIIGIPELNIPGEISRNKQWTELRKLVVETPMGEKSSVPVEEMDEHEVEITVCLDFIHGERGQILKRTNKNGYMNVLLHIQEHKFFLMGAANNGGQGPGTEG